ncbi:hypothetical protein RchiOBHm_Chr1g0340461 [Rosa chinensis]|uniref:Uncharacterized protein n=1 Tax=Rosa chinensis TaxID=74649 RepID=A0A2P6SDH9_ROSCH|nr:hypothetical protein RchiOBHm_Chr1g0340461 [Rosa chinensis]
MGGVSAYVAARNPISNNHRYSSLSSFGSMQPTIGKRYNMSKFCTFGFV